MALTPISGEIQAQPLNDNFSSIDAQLADVAKPIVSFTFDDGYDEDDLTYSILKEYGYVGSFGLVTDQFYNAGKNPLDKYNQYQKEGFEIIGHSATHADLTSETTSEDEKYKEMKSSANKLRGLGFSSNGFIVPYSNISSNNLAYAKDIYDYILIGGTGLNGKNDFKDKTLTRISQYAQGVQAIKDLIDQAINENKSLILYDHRIGQTGSLTELEFRDILDYLQTKTNANLIQVHNVKDAINKYYGINVLDRVIVRSNKNVIPSLVSSTWGMTDTGTGATETRDPDYTEPVRRISVPSGATIGSYLEFSNIYTLPSDFETLGEKIDFSSIIKMANSEYSYFDRYIDVELLDGSDVVLISKTNTIYPTNTTFEIPKLEYFNDIGVTVANIKKVKVIFRFVINTSPTVLHHIRIFSAKLIFPNLKFSGLEKVDEGFSARLMTIQPVANSTHTTILFDEVFYSDNLSYNASNGGFSVKQSGVYQINGSVRWASMIDGTRLICAAFVGEVQNLSMESRGNGTLTQATTLSTMLKLSKGDVLTIRGFQDSGGSLDVSIGNYTWASVYLIR